MNSIKVGIIGCGFVGSALKQWLEHNNQRVILRISDPYKGYNDSLEDIDVAFIQIHVPTEADGTQDLTLIKELINKIDKKVPIFIRTTILPGTSELLTKDTGHNVYYMPEFLTERTYIEDFNKQTLIFTGCIELLKDIFVNRKFIIMSPLEAEIAKYSHNVFGALKVTYFNCVYDYCKRMGISYENVQRGILNSGYINDVHTYVPGPDGKFGYGGKCFPKDVNALIAATKGLPLNDIISSLPKLNDMFRC